MADPDKYDNNPYGVCITPLGLKLVQRTYMYYGYRNLYDTGANTKPVETKKQKIARIAKELMYASWKMYNQKTVSVIEIVQIQKPRHRTHFYGKA